MLGGPDGIDATRARTAAPVPGQIDLGIDRAIRLRGDVVESPHMRVREQDRRPEPLRTQAVGVKRGLELRSSLPVRRRLVGHHELAVGPEGGTAVVADAVSRRHGLRRAE